MRKDVVKICDGEETISDVEVDGTITANCKKAGTRANYVI